MKNLKDIKILMTGIGAPGANGIIKSIRLNNERYIYIVGVDSDIDNSIGIGWVDKAIKIPSAKSTDFIQELYKIAVDEKVSIILPLVTNELFLISQNKKMFNDKNIEILVSDFEKLNLVNNKYSLLKFCEKIGIPTPDYRLVSSIEEFKNAAFKLGYPEKKICFKPPISNGSRGFRIISNSTNRMDYLINEKPNNVFISMDEFLNIANESSYFPQLLLMEYLPGKEFSVDALGDGNKCIKVIPRTRDKIKMGISFVGTTIEDKRLIKYASQLIESLKLFGNIGFQFKEDDSGTPKIIESNPRVQGTIVLCTASGYNMVYNAIKIALKEEPLQYNINWGTKMIRYWDELYFKENNKVSFG